MTNEWMMSAGLAMWLGVLTSISPCPLATNIAAVSYISRRLEKSRLAAASGVLYTAGRTLAYLTLGVLISASMLSIPEVSRFLQTYMNKLLGPLLIIVGMLLLELIKLPTGSGSRWGQWIQRRADKLGVLGAGLLGFFFALSFCPVSAALFFGTLVPISVKSGSVFALPILYGIGTALPVLGFGLAIAAGSKALGRIFQRVTQFEHWARRITGGTFIAIGIYMCTRFILLM